jgi:hypothetical protein
MQNAYSNVRYENMHRACINRLQQLKPKDTCHTAEYVARSSCMHAVCVPLGLLMAPAASLQPNNNHMQRHTTAHQSPT